MSYIVYEGSVNEYYGRKVSKNAGLAFDKGERPKKEWTRERVLNAVNSVIKDKNVVALIDFDTFNNKDLFSLFLNPTVHHHVDFNEDGVPDGFPQFYEINCDAVLEYARPYTPQEQKIMKDFLDAQQQLDAANERNEQLAKELNSYKTELNTLQQHYEHLTRENLIYHEEMAQAAKDYQKELWEGTVFFDEAVQNNRKLEEKNSKLEKQNKKLKKRLQDKSEQLEKLEVAQSRQEILLKNGTSVIDQVLKKHPGAGAVKKTKSDGRSLTLKITGYENKQIIEDKNGNLTGGKAVAKKLLDA